MVGPKHLALSKLQFISNLAISTLGRFWYSSTTHAGRFKATFFFLSVHMRRTWDFAASSNLSWQ